jgi:hypothetical protein
VHSQIVLDDSAAVVWKDLTVPDKIQESLAVPDLQPPTLLSTGFCCLEAASAGRSAIGS